MRNEIQQLQYWESCDHVANEMNLKDNSVLFCVTDGWISNIKIFVSCTFWSLNCCAMLSFEPILRHKKQIAFSFSIMTGRRSNCNIKVQIQKSWLDEGSIVPAHWDLAGVTIQGLDSRRPVDYSCHVIIIIYLFICGGSVLSIPQQRRRVHYFCATMHSICRLHWQGQIYTWRLYLSSGPVPVGDSSHGGDGRDPEGWTFRPHLSHALSCVDAHRPVSGSVIWLQNHPQSI